MAGQGVSIFWFRRDLRLEDNHGLFRALQSGRPVKAVFIFDSEILSKLPNKKDPRVEFIFRRLEALRLELRAHGSDLHTYHGSPLSIWRTILDQESIRSIYCNEDYETYALRRDSAVAELAARKNVNFYALKDQVIFAKNEIVKDDGQPYRVFTPYSKRWLERFKKHGLETYASHKHLKNLARGRAGKTFALKDLGFEPAGIELPAGLIQKTLLKSYARTRDQLGERGTSHLGIHLRFGTGSIRKLVGLANEYSKVYLSELIWREFFQQILYHFPHTESEPFDARYAKIEWINDKKQFQAWKSGRTGYPIVDAAMHELGATGFMHNRARMITASFLTKHLLIDWRWGERYFAEKLLDYDLASNVGNWQWAAGCGCDAAPYFRIFNPALQAKKFDPKGTYVSKWDGNTGLDPIVEHTFARNRALKAFKKALG